MPEYLHPGVYVEEIDAGPKPIEGVSTSTAGAVGVTARGPSSGKPVLVTSFADFERRFGGFLPEPASALYNQWSLNPSEGGHWWHFALAVKGFFENGGQRLYIKRVFSSTAQSSNTTLGQGVVAELARDAAGTDTTIRLRHLLGVENGSQLNLFAGGNALANNPFAVTAYDPVSRSVTLNQPLGQEMKAGRDFAEVRARVAPGPPPTQTLRFRAKAVGGWGNGLSVRARPMVGATMSILPDPAAGGNPASTTLELEGTAGANTLSVTGLAGLSNNDRVSIDGGEYVISNLTPGNPDTLDINPAVPAGQTWPAGTIVRRLRPANTPPDATINVQGAARLYANALIELDNGTNKELVTVSSIAGDLVTVAPALAQSYFEGHKVRVIEAEVSVRYTRDNLIEAEERFPNLRLFDDGSLSYLVNHIAAQSDLIEVETQPGFSTSNFDVFPIAGNGAWQNLTGGNDNLAGLSVDDFVGTDGGSGNRTGIQALEDIDEISIVMAPGIWSTTVHNGLVNHCELLRDRFAVLDPQEGLGIEEIRTFREPFDTKYAALYYPWLEVRDPSVRRNVFLAPSAHMIGIYARTDVDRGVHKAPANEVIRGIIRITQDVTNREQDLLNPNGINALRFFPGRGNRVWGARTLSSDSSWKYINVRRLFIFVEESLDEGTQWVVFEPNDEPLWARVRQSITNFLTTVWRSGALQGLTAEEAFFVKVDRTTMTQDDIDNGRLIIQVGIAPVKPAEFVIIRIQQKTIESQS